MKKECSLRFCCSDTMLGLTARKSPVLLTIADEKITLENLKGSTGRTTTMTSLNKQTPEEYLELFINFKLKVKEAEVPWDGYHHPSSSMSWKDTESNLAKPYLTDEETKEDDDERRLMKGLK